MTSVSMHVFEQVTGVGGVWRADLRGGKTLELLQCATPLCRPSCVRQAIALAHQMPLWSSPESHMTDVV